MSVPCPACKAPLNPKGLKPGTYKPKCPKCGTMFQMIVPAATDGTILAKLITAPPPATKPEPKPEAAYNPHATGDFTEIDPNATAPPSPASIDDDEDPNSTGNFTEPAAFNPQATGNFTEIDPNATAAPDAPQAIDQTAALPSEEPPPAKSSKKKKAPADEPIPEKLGGYDVIKILGKGGMGAVLLGRQVSLDRKVALKIMHARLAKDPGFVARFTREAYAAAQLTHHNVIQIYDIGEDRGTHFFSMEFVNGKSLMELVKSEGKLDIEVAVGYILQAARGLRYGHVQGMVHRDIKPDNLMLNTDGIVKVADLGLVKLPAADLPPPKESAQSDADLESEDGDTQRLTRAGVVMGTPAYMPPEQARDSASVDQRADIYSLGCSLYVMVTGKPPFEGKTALEVISKHQTEPLVPPEAIVKRVPKALSGILQKMMAKQPEDRFQTMDDVIAALEGFLGMSRSGPITPKEEHAETLEKATTAFTAVSKAGTKKLLGLAFFALCFLGIIVCGAIGRFSIAGGFLGLMLMAPVAYYAIHGVMTKSFLWGKTREWLSGFRILDWLMAAGGGVLLLLSLYIFGWLWFWLGFCLLAIGLAYLLYMLADQAQAAKQAEPIEEARRLIKTMRLQGIEEESLRQFVCKYSGANWEAFYEALFGYPAKLEARQYRKGAVTEDAPKYAAWREPLIGWFDAKVRERREAAERKHLLKVQAKALESEGVSAAEAQVQAEELAGVMVGAAAQAREAVKEGKKIDIQAMVAIARAKKRPAAGYNIAGIKIKTGPSLKDRLNGFFGRRFRLFVGAAVFALGMLWLHQTERLKQVSKVAESVSAQVAAGDLKAAGDAGKTVAKVQAAAVRPGLEFLPDAIGKPFQSYSAPIAGILMILTGILYHGGRPSIVAVPGLVIALLGPSFGIPEAGLPAWAISTIIGGVLMLIVGRFLRE
ncbi:MAG: serine/threonine-protein kinase [Gemmataceae bacterium]